MQWKVYGILAGAIFFASACSDSMPQTSDESGDVQGAFALPVPVAIASVRAIDLDRLFVQILVNGREQPLVNGTLTTSFSVPIGSTLEISVLWFEEQTDRAEDLLLASWASTRVVSDNESISILPEQYETTGEAFDADNDSFSNLLERREDSNPYNPNETPINRPDVRILRIDPDDAPEIDGRYDPIWNTGARFSDVDGNLLSIDNLMINQGARRPDGSTELRWFAMHDDTNLYVFVLGEFVRDAIPMRDSNNVWRDDNVNLFIDGDNSKGNSYDGVDDRHLLVPLLTAPDDRSENTTVFTNGEFSASPPEFEFATCLCATDQHTWEFKLPFSEIDIELNRPFGFEVQIDLDHTGGDRDARWGWFHPSRVDEDVDNTRRDPSFMGTAVVE